MTKNLLELGKKDRLIFTQESDIDVIHIQQIYYNA